MSYTNDLTNMEILERANQPMWTTVMLTFVPESILKRVELSFTDIQLELPSSFLSTKTIAYYMTNYITDTYLSNIQYEGKEVSGYKNYYYEILGEIVGKSIIIRKSTRTTNLVDDNFKAKHNLVFGFNTCILPTNDTSE